MGFLTRLSHFKLNTGNCWRLAVLSPGYQQREVKGPGEQFCEMTLPLQASMPMWVPSHPAGEGGVVVLHLRTARCGVYASVLFILKHR